MGEGVEAKYWCVCGSPGRAEQPCWCRQCQRLITATQSIATNTADSIGHGGHMSRRTANKKLANVYWPSRKRSPKLYYCTFRPKKWRDFAPDGCSPFSNSFRRHWPQTRRESYVKDETILPFRPTYRGFSISWHWWSRRYALHSGTYVNSDSKFCCWHQWRKAFFWSLMTLSFFLVSRPNRVGNVTELGSYCVCTSFGSYWCLWSL